MTVANFFNMDLFLIIVNWLPYVITQGLDTTVPHLSNYSSVILNHTIKMTLENDANWIRERSESMKLMSDLNLNSTGNDKKWISEMFDDAKRMFDMHPGVSYRCKKDFDVYKLQRRNQSVWAVRMMESSEWPVIGILSGATVHMGDYTECLKSAGPGFRGKYCLVGGNFLFNGFETSLPSSTPDYFGEGWISWPDENASAWRVINQYESNRLRFSRQDLTWAMCIPSSCKASDLRISIVRTLKPILKANRAFGIVNRESWCTVKDQVRSVSVGYYRVRVFLVSLVILVILATMYDATLDHTAWSEECWQLGLLRCFSAKESCKRLTRNSAGAIPILYMLKIVATFFIIKEHDTMLTRLFPKTDTELLEMEYRSFNLELLLSSILGTFFTISGFLTLYFGVSSAKETGIIHVILSIVFRWLKLTPVLGVAILAYTFILPYLGDGPLWNGVWQAQVSLCKSKWWTNLLAVNNFYNIDEQCFGHSWYISVDFQLSIVGSLLTYIASKHKVCGVLLMLVTFTSANVATFLQIYQNNLYGPTVSFTTTLSANPAKDQQNKLYYKTYYRVGPYLVGTAAALLTRELEEKKYKFSSMHKVLLLVPSFMIGFGSQIYILSFYRTGRPYNSVENAVYGVLHQVLFAIPIACLTVVYVVSGLGIFNKFVGFKLYVPVGRLIYCMYLVSLPVQLYHFSSMKRPYSEPNKAERYWRAITNLVYTVPLAFFFFLITEGPITNALKLFGPWMVKKLK